MPLFEYECMGCGHVFEVMVMRQGSGSKPTCPECKGLNVERVWSPFSGRSEKGESCGGGVSGFR
jgi:putative FmdB family regulatory protein